MSSQEIWFNDEQTVGHGSRQTAQQRLPFICRIKEPCVHIPEIHQSSQPFQPRHNLIRLDADENLQSG